MRVNKQFAENFFNELCMDFYNPETGSVNKLDKFYSKDLLVEIGAYKLNYGRFKNRIQNVHKTYDSCKFNIKNIIAFGDSFIIDFSCAFSPRDAEKNSLVKSLVVYFTLRKDKVLHEKVLSEENFYFEVEENLSVAS
ncbi:MAG: hypothetical protein ACJA0H_000518 [Francisellaceae bacterium]|jgi:hypothetical protein